MTIKLVRMDTCDDLPLSTKPCNLLIFWSRDNQSAEFFKGTFLEDSNIFETNWKQYIFNWLAQQLSFRTAAKFFEVCRVTLGGPVFQNCSVNADFVFKCSLVRAQNTCLKKHGGQKWSKFWKAKITMWKVKNVISHLPRNL